MSPEKIMKLTSEKWEGVLSFSTTHIDKVSLQYESEDDA